MIGRGEVSYLNWRIHGWWWSMSGPDPTGDERERLETEAVTWIVRLTSGEATEADHDAVNAWRRLSPAHEDAFLKVERLWIGFEGLRSHIAEPSAGFHSTKSAPASSTVASAGRGRRATARSRVAWRAIAATLVAIAITVVLQSGFFARLSADYRTGTGDQETARLADGSLLQLNTQAAVAIRFTDSTRRVELLEGEADFQVAKDTSRPFVVTTDDGNVRAVGTEFMVRKMPDTTVVTVIEGIVEIRALPGRSGGDEPVRLEAGQHLQFGPALGVGPVQRVDTHLATAWQRNKLIFEGTPVATVVDEINRYRPGHIMLLSPSLSNHRVSGVFDLDRLDSAVAAIERTLPVTTVHMTNRYVFLR